MTLDDYLRKGSDMRASDVHLTAGREPSCRVDGVITSMSKEILDTPTMEQLVYALLDRMKMPSLKETYERTGEADFALSVPALARFRINIFHQRASCGLVARKLNSKIPDPRELGVPDAVVQMCNKRRGLVLVTGATGSGKSTTLASMINIINNREAAHIITLEDPIEYLHSHNKSIVNQREIGTDTMSFAAALRAALREDPDVILVGEMRDLETISAAVTAAETGHLVFSTLHTIGAANTIDRIIDVFPPHQQQQIRTQLAEVVECVVSQQLLPRFGTTGRVAAMEVMLANSAIKNHIREGKTFQIASTIQTSRKIGMLLMDDAIYELYQRGDIDGDTALAFAQDPNSLAKKLTLY